ncbi:hypothetical protein A4X13_0g773 [Tilletia indica]|uniref:ATP-dependent RNA helicase n=1 Tax=Tilletia indica TaxID=43049 RepID=A0A177TQH1_9BASI|nr:hypothetical protein A4X13_0g773 [Tilletia indica]
MAGNKQEGKAKKMPKPAAGSKATPVTAPMGSSSFPSASASKKRKLPSTANDSNSSPAADAAQTKRVKKDVPTATAPTSATGSEPQSSKQAARFHALQQKKKDFKKKKIAKKEKDQQEPPTDEQAESAGPSSSSKKTRKQVKLSALTWNPVALPTEAISSGGGSTTDADFFAGLFDGDMNDYMGLQEVTGVRVRYSAADGRGEREEGGVEDEEMEDGEKDGEESKGGKVLKFLVQEEEEEGDEQEEGEEQDEENTVVASKADAKKKKAPVTTATPKLSKKSGKAEKKEEEGPVEAVDDDDEVDEDDDEEEEEEDSEDLAHVDWAALDAFDESKLPGWSELDIDVRLKGGLWKLNFAEPTKIQAATLPVALGSGEASDAVPEPIPTSKKKAAKGKAGKEVEDAGEVEGQVQCRDVVGVAQTGSGKTLAYGLPILQHFLSTVLPSQSSGGEREDEDIRPLTALVLTPTRELAIQVADHLQGLVNAAAQVNPVTSAEKVEKKHWVSIVTVCGGMSVQKQRRLLMRGKGADIVVATPGRLWELLSEDDDFAARLKQIRFLVVDEADRMVEVGHFAEMDNILRLVRRPSEAADFGDDLVEEVNPSKPLNAVAQSFVAKVEGGREDLQTFVFSATLSKDLQRNLTRAKRKTLSRKKRAETSTLDDLMMRIDFRDPDPVIIDLSPDSGIAEGVHEMKFECLTKDKDLYLYYFLLRYPGRTLVFLNSIDGIRRLVPILTHLGLNPFPLHSQLQQKQRLKNLDRFRALDLSNPASSRGQSGGSSGKDRLPASAVILATDVAARGLDIKGVDHVVHYQLPRSADTYVHRSGRTGRAGTEGVALAMIDPAEKRVWNEIRRSLSRKDSVPAMTVEFSFFDPLRARLDLAKQIDNAVHRAAKDSHDDAWLRKMAEDADIDIDEDGGDHRLDFDDDGNGSKKNKANAKAAKVGKLKEELDALLRQPLKARGVSFKYLTSGSRTNFAEEVMNSNRRDIVTDAPKLLTARGKQK